MIVAQLALEKKISEMSAHGVSISATQIHSQSSQAQNHNHRELQPALHLDWPQQNRRENRQRQVRDDRHGREEEADMAVEARVTHTACLAPQGRHRVADVADGDDENDRAAELQGDEGPEAPDEGAAGLGDADQADADATFDRDRAGGVEEFGDVEELMVGNFSNVSQTFCLTTLVMYVGEFSLVQTYLCPTHDGCLGQIL